MAAMASKESPSGMKIYTSQPWNLSKTRFLCLTWMIMGMQYAFVSATAYIIAANANISMHGTISFFRVELSGYLVANIFGAILLNIVKKHSDCLLICAFISSAITLFSIPFVTSSMLMYVCFFIQNIAGGFIYLGGIHLLLTMWGVNAAAPLSMVYLAFEIGVISRSILLDPFLTEKVSSINARDNEGVHLMSTSIRKIKHDVNIVTPYSIIAVLCALVAIGHIFFYIREQKSQKQNLLTQQTAYTAVSTNPENVNRSVGTGNSSPCSPRTCGRGFFQYGLRLSILFICYAFFVGGNEKIFKRLYFNYLYNAVGSLDRGFILYSLSYLIGRIIGAIVSVFLPVNECLNIFWFCGLCLAIAWSIFIWVIGLTVAGFWTLSGATGLVLAPIFPLSLGLINQRLNVTPTLLALLLCALRIGTHICDSIAGNSFASSAVFNSFRMFLELAINRNSVYRQMLLIMCTLMAIFLYVASELVYVAHQRINAPISANGTILSPESVGEDEQQIND